MVRYTLGQVLSIQAKNVYHYYLVQYQLNDTIIYQEKNICLEGRYFLLPLLSYMLIYKSKYHTFV